MPSWQAHRSIVQAVLQELPLPREVVEGVMKGVVDPDKTPDREVKLRIYGNKGVSFREGYAKHHGSSRKLVEYYLNLSLYYFRRRDLSRAGFMLGRALHYVQDGSLSRRKFLILDVHEVEEAAVNKLAEAPESVVEFCRSVNVIGEESSNAEEALCIAFRKTRELLSYFTSEINRNIDTAAIKRNVRRIRLVKALVLLAIAALTLSSPIVLLPSLIIAPAVALYRPRAYYEAMRAGLMIIKPIGYTVAY